MRPSVAWAATLPGAFSMMRPIGVRPDVIGTAKQAVAGFRHEAGFEEEAVASKGRLLARPEVVHRPVMNLPHFPVRAG